MKRIRNLSDWEKLVEDAEKDMYVDQGGECEHCNSTRGHWSGKNIWLCHDCKKHTIYYEATELGKQVLKELLSEKDSLLRSVKE